MTRATITPGVSSILVRILDHSRHIDYIILFLIGLVPIILAPVFGVHESITGSSGLQHSGFWQQPNFTSMPVLLPLILFAFRWIMGKITPVTEQQLPLHPPPIVTILTNEHAKKRHYTELRSSILSKSNLFLVIIILLLMGILDLYWFVSMYFSDIKPAPEKIDWMTMFLVNDSVSRSGNFTVVIFAYLGQLVATFFGILIVILFFRHNLYFIRHIYQRRWDNSQNERPFFQIDVNDVNRCFGFRPTNEAFNTQVKALMIAGAAMFLSRFVYTREDKCPAGEPFTFLPQGSEFCFAVPGQWLMPVVWIVGLFIVAMPAFIKLLPWLSGRGSERIHLCVENYLQEFFNDDTWPKKSNDEPESVEVVARKFARNSFWPTGDNRAKTLFFLSYFIFIIILIPPRSSFELWQIVFRLIEYGIIAYLITIGTLSILKWGLRYVDEMLVMDKVPLAEDHLQPKEPTPEKTELGIFISYRRRDSAPYARSILEYLQTHFHKEYLFMDIDNIKPGVRFGEEIDRALNRVDAVIALIGRDWSSITDDGDEKPRIHQSGDMVRYEIETALKLEKHIYPVLVGGATMPGENELPEPLQDLAQINAVEISDSRWEYDLGILIDALKHNQPGE